MKTVEKPKRFCVVALTILLLIVVTVFTYCRVRRRMIIWKRVESMNAVRYACMGHVGYPLYEYLNNNQLSYLDKFERYPLVKLLVFEGENAVQHRDPKGYERQECNSWRINLCDWLDAGATPWKYRDGTRFLPWYDRRNVFGQDDYFCWSDDYSYPNDSPFPEALCASVMTIRGPGTITDLLERGDYSDEDASLANMICLIEVARSKTHWAQRGDLNVDALPDDLPLGIDGYGVTVMFGDESVWYLDKSVPLESLRTLMTLDGARNHTRDELLGPYKLKSYK